MNATDPKANKALAKWGEGCYEDLDVMPNMRCSGGEPSQLQ